MLYRAWRHASGCLPASAASIEADSAADANSGIRVNARSTLSLGWRPWLSEKRHQGTQADSDHEDETGNLPGVELNGGLSLVRCALASH